MSLARTKGASIMVHCQKPTFSEGTVSLLLPVLVVAFRLSPLQASVPAQSELIQIRYNGFPNQPRSVLR